MGVTDRQYLLDLEAFLDGLITNFNAMSVALSLSNAEAEAGLLVSGALAIHGAASPLFKTTATIWYVIGNGLYTKAATDNLAFTANTPVIGNNQIAAFTLVIDNAGNFSTVASPAVANPPVAATPLVWQPAPAGKAVVGLILIACAVTTFTPNTTNLDAASVTVTYINPLSGGELLSVPSVPLPYAVPASAPAVAGVSQAGRPNFY